MDDARELIEHPTPDFPPVYSPESVEQILQLTNGQPYLVQLLCYELVEYLNSDTSVEQVKPGDTLTMLPKIFEREHHYFREFWKENLNTTQREALTAVASGDVLQAETSGILKSLATKKILLKTNGSYQFQVPLMAQWVAQRIEQHC